MFCIVITSFTYCQLHTYPTGANVQSCSERFGVTVDALLENSCVGQTIDDVCKKGSPVNIIDALWLLWNS